MNRINKLYLSLLFTSAVLLTSCSDQLPVELVDDTGATEESMQIEMIANDLENESYSNGYDSTGILPEAVKSYSSIIYLTGIRTTYENTDYLKYNYQCAFFNKDKPVYSPGGDLIAFQTYLSGRIFFDADTASIVRFFVKYRSQGEAKDTLVGPKYVLTDRQKGSSHQNRFPFNSAVKYRQEKFNGDIVQFTINTPPEIVGRLSKVEDPNDNSKKTVRVNWNGQNRGEVEMIIGGVPSGKLRPFPLYRVRTGDDGEITLPRSLIEAIPVERFTKIVFSLIRRVAAKPPGGNFDESTSLIGGQSIHNIYIDAN